MNNLSRRVGNRIRQIVLPSALRELSPAMLAGYFKARGVEPKLFLEIGANDGADTNIFLEAFPGVEIHCFEPDPRAISAFKRNVKSPRAHLHETAIGSTDGTLNFYQSDGAPPPEESTSFRRDGTSQVQSADPQAIWISTSGATLRSLSKCRSNVSTHGQLLGALIKSTSYGPTSKAPKWT